MYFVPALKPANTPAQMAHLSGFCDWTILEAKSRLATRNIVARTSTVWNRECMTCPGAIAIANPPAAAPNREMRPNKIEKTIQAVAAPAKALISLPAKCPEAVDCHELTDRSGP